MPIRKPGACSFALLWVQHAMGHWWTWITILANVQWLAGSFWHWHGIDRSPRARAQRPLVPRGGCKWPCHRAGRDGLGPCALGHVGGEFIYSGQGSGRSLIATPSCLAGTPRVRGPYILTDYGEALSSHQIQPLAARSSPPRSCCLIGPASSNELLCYKLSYGN